MAKDLAARLGGSFNQEGTFNEKVSERYFVPLWDSVYVSKAMFTLDVFF